MVIDDALAGRLRDRLRGTDGVTEKRMFGGLAFLIDGAIIVGVYGDGLLVRVGTDDLAEAMRQAGAQPFTMSGRASRGWVVVAAEALDDRALDRWLGQARAFVATLPPK